MAHAAQAHPGAQDAGKYYIPHGSKWPIVGSASLFTMMLGAAALLNGVNVAPYIFWGGFLAVLYMFYGWFGTVIGENQAGLYNEGVDKSFRMGMMWFIFSEVMFFGAFFGALYYARQLSVPWLGGEGSKFLTNMFLWKEYDPAWPTNGPAAVGGAFETIPAFGLPAINTAILLTSGVTITIAHHALKAGNRTVLKIFLALTFLLGFLFVGLQAEEYMHAYQELNLTLGAIMLVVIWLRVMKGHFTPQHHFAFEGVAWYWHFVDVVWLGLFIFVYWL